MNTAYKSPIPVDVTDPQSMQFGTTQNLRRIAQNERHISRNQRGEAASALDWAADRIDELEKVASHPTVPVGWKIVPLEPTEEMIVAGDAVAPSWIHGVRPLEMIV